MTRTRFVVVAALVACPAVLPAQTPRPRIIGATYGLDTIAHGVLTAVRLPGPYVLQSARYERRRG